MQPPAASEATVTTSARGLMTPLERERQGATMGPIHDGPSAPISLVAESCRVPA